MQISGNDKDHIRQTYQTLAPLNNMLTVIGLGSRLTDNKKPKTFWLITKNVLRASVLAIIDCYMLFYKITHLTETVSPSIRYTDYVQVVYDFVQYTVDLFYIRKYGPVHSEYLQKYQMIDRFLIAMSYDTSFKTLLRIMGFFIILWLSSSICDFIAWVLNCGWAMASVYSLMYIFLLIKILTTLDLTSQIMQIECRLCTIGNLLEICCSATESGSPLFEINKKKWIHTIGKVAEQSSMPSNAHRRELPQVGDYPQLKCLGRCYLLLTEQAVFVNKMYGTRILLNSLSLLIDMVRFTNIAARILIGSQKTKYGYVSVVSSIIRLLICAAVLMSLVRHCEQVYRQRERIMDIIYNLLFFKKPNDDLKTAASELRDLIQARPINFTMANFCRLDYSLLTSITSMVVTYTIILLQAIN